MMNSKINKFNRKSKPYTIAGISKFRSSNSKYNYHRYLNLINLSKKYYDIDSCSIFCDMDGFYDAQSGDTIELTRYIPNIKMEYITKWIR